MDIKRLGQAIPYADKLYKHWFGMRFGRSLSPDGVYRIDPVEDLPAFTMLIENPGLVDLQKVRGTYEQDVQRVIAENTDSSDEFWEVGAYYGFFSLAAAPVVDSVKAFEPVPAYARGLEEGVEHNEYTNVDIIRGEVGNGIALGDHGKPDIALMDIEGAELAVIRSSKEFVASVHKWIVELHEPHLSGVDDRADPSATLDLLEELGFRTTVISERKEGNFHIYAKK